MLKRGALIAMLGAALMLGCGGGDDKKDSSDAGATKTSTATSTATTPSGDTRSAPEQALASRAGNVDDDPVTLEIVELKRSGGTTALTIRLVAKEQKPGTDIGGNSQVASTFDDGIFQKLKTTDDPTAGADSLDGISLIDSKNRKRYLVGRDEDGACVCDTDLGNAFVKSGAPLLLSATFAAPPEDVDAMDVVIPHFGTFKDVPLS